MLALLGLDSVSVPLLDELVADGRMPALGALRERGRTVPLEQPGSSFAASAFHTLWTGVDVQDHALYYPFLWSPSDQRVIHVERRPSPPSFWETASRAGARVLVVDPYEGRQPTRPVDTCLSGVQLRNRVVLRRWGTPREALRRWEGELGRSPTVDEVFGQHDRRSLGGLVGPLVSASARAATLVERALQTQPPDLLVAMLPAVHIAGHQLWDPAAVLPRGTRPSAELERALRDVYAAADAALGRILAALPEDADVVVFSVLGMTVNSSRNDLLPGMVDAVLRGRAREDADPGFAWRMRARVPMRLRANVARALPTRVALELTARAELRGTDWAHTRAFCVPSDTTGLIRLNRKDRERNGIVPAAEADALLDELAEGLGTFEEEDGAPVVIATERPHDTLPNGRCSELLPDLVVHWRPTQAARTEYVTSSRFGTVRRQGAGTGRSGNHMPDAWALVVPGASRPRVPGRPHAVTDLHATALTACGVASGGEPFFE